MTMNISPLWETGGLLLVRELRRSEEEDRKGLATGGCRRLVAYPQQPIVMGAYQPMYAILTQVATPTGKANAPAQPGLSTWNHQSTKPSRGDDYANTTLLYLML